MRRKLVSTRFGSYVGDEAITSTRPVRGSRATADPQMPLSAESAVSWARRSSVSTRSFPVIVAPRRRSSVVSSTVLRFAFAPTR
jgi:hypothetical protein